MMIGAWSAICFLALVVAVLMWHIKEINSEIAFLRHHVGELRSRAYAANLLQRKKVTEVKENA